MIVRPLSPALEKKARKELNEIPNRTTDDLVLLREFLKSESHLEHINPSDQWLLAFLRGSKFSLQRSKEKLEMFYTLRAIVPEFFADRDPMSPRLQLVLKAGVFLPVRKCASEDGTRVSIVRVGVMDPAQFHLSDIIKIAFMVTEIMMLEDDNFSVAGEEVIIDMKNSGMGVLSQWTPALAKKVIMCFEKALPIRQKGNHILNTPTGFEAAYKILKMFLGDKMKKRLQVHNKNYKALHKGISKTILPVEYEGEDGTIQELIDYWKQKVESYSEWFKEQSTQTSNEDKRLEGPKITNEMFGGLEGSFRKLELD